MTAKVRKGDVRSRLARHRALAKDIRKVLKMGCWTGGRGAGPVVVAVVAVLVAVAVVVVVAAVTQCMHSCMLLSG